MEKNIENRPIVATCYYCRLRIKANELILHIAEQHLKKGNPKEEGGGENREIAKPKMEGGE